MLVVIADDLTGAAELGGIGLRYGLGVEMATVIDPASKADLLAVATDTRSGSEAEAVRHMTAVSETIRAMNPRLVYKKTDSVLRGHVMAELTAQLTALGKSRALVVSANPALGRTLVAGHYYVEGQLIHQTAFATDPEFPITESDVRERFRTAAGPALVQPPHEGLPGAGIVIGEARNQADLHAWATHLDEQTLPCGGSGFFTALLDTLALAKPNRLTPPPLGKRRLYVCGSAFEASARWVSDRAAAGWPVRYMPPALKQMTPTDPSTLTQWATDTATNLQQNDRVIMAIAPTSDDGQGLSAPHLRTVMARTVAAVLNRATVDELLIEGGSTASAVLRELGISRLLPVDELAPGVVRSALPESASGRSPRYITVKPGSYRWP